MPSVFSANAVIMPKNAATHIQNTAPGPPMASAAATPAMLPVPTVAASAVHIAAKGEIACPSLSVLRWGRQARSAPPSHSRMYRSWNTPVQQVKYSPVPSSRMSSGGPQSTPRTASLIRAMVSSMRIPPFGKVYA